jgi:hypothetical protein
MAVVSAANGFGGQLHSTAELQLGEKVLDVRSDCCPLYQDPFGDLRIGEAVGGQGNHLALGGCEAVPTAFGSASAACGQGRRSRQQRASRGTLGCDGR